MTTERITDLLDQWQEAYENGQDLSAEELCSGFPEDVVQECAERIAMRRLMQRLGMESSSAFRFERGAIVQGTEVDFELVEELGEGGFGLVWKAKNLRTQQFVALKFCDENDASALATLRNEKHKLERIRDKLGELTGIVRLLDFSLDENPPFLAFEYFENKDFECFLRDFFDNADGFSPAAAAEIIHDLATIMADVHALEEPIAHRDLKPANILIANIGPLEFKITDFGIGVVAVTSTIAAELSRPDPGRRWRGGVGTPLYMSDEQRNPDHSGDPTDDVHALGVMWYQLLTSSLSKGRPSGPAWQADLLNDGMTQDQLDLLNSCFDHRTCPKTAGELASKIEAKFTLPLYQTRKDAKAAAKLRSDGLDWLGFVGMQSDSHFEFWKEAARHDDAYAHWLMGLCFENGINCDANLALARDCFEKATFRRSYPEAEYDFALYCKYGLADEGRDDLCDEGQFLFDKAAFQGHRDAQYELGLCYLEGQDNDREKAIFSFKKAADQNHADALFQLGRLFSEGRGNDIRPFVQAGSDKVISTRVCTDFAQDLDQIGLSDGTRKRLESGGLSTLRDVLDRTEDELRQICNYDDSCLFNLWTSFRNFHLDPWMEVKTECERCFQGAARLGHIDAQFELAMILVAKDLEHPFSNPEALQWLKKAAAKGHMDAQFRLGEWLYHELNDDTDSSHDRLIEAVDWLLCAAGRGHCDSIGFLHNSIFGGDGVAPLGIDPQEVIRWMRISAELGDVRAQFSLGMNLTTLSVDGDPPLSALTAAEEGRNWLKKAAENGHADAQYMFATVCDGSHDNSIPARNNDCAAAEKWYQKAAEQGHCGAGQKLLAIRRSLGSSLAPKVVGKLVITTDKNGNPCFSYVGP